MKDEYLQRIATALERIAQRKVSPGRPRKQDTPWEERIRAWTDQSTAVTVVTLPFLLARVFGTEDPTATELKLAGRAMKRIGWKRVRVQDGQTRQWMYRRAAAQEQPK